VFLHRDNPVLRPFVGAFAGGDLRVTPARPEDHAWVRETVARFEGEDSAGLAGYWLRRRPDAWRIVRSSTGERAGGYLPVILETTDVRDPAVERAGAWLARNAVTLASYADPECWAVTSAYGDFARVPDADFTVGGRTHGVYAHDWRLVPPTAWLELLAARETAEQPLAIAPCTTRTCNRPAATSAPPSCSTCR
jgi:hypothetical protein